MMAWQGHTSAQVISSMTRASSLWPSRCMSGALRGGQGSYELESNRTLLLFEFERSIRIYSIKIFARIVGKFEFDSSSSEFVSREAFQPIRGQFQCNRLNKFSLFQFNHVSLRHILSALIGPFCSKCYNIYMDITNINNRTCFKEPYAI